MQKNSQDFSTQEAMQLAKTPAGQQLLAQLQQQHSQQLQQILTMAKSGNMAAAGSALQQLLQTDSARALVKQLEEQAHG